ARAGWRIPRLLGSALPQLQRRAVARDVPLLDRLSVGAVLRAADRPLLVGVGPHARGFAPSLPPGGAQFAPRSGPSARVSPHARGFAPSLPPEGAQFAPRSGPSARMSRFVVALALLALAACSPEGPKFKASDVTGASFG